jgi:flagellar motor switch protein FliM
MEESGVQMETASVKGEMLRDEGIVDTAVGLEMSAQAMEEHPGWPMISRLPVTLSVNIPLKRFKVRDLLGLACGQTVHSSWAVTEDVPLNAGKLQLNWGEFEVVDHRMALRLTRLA